jgi:hypothetical protein
VPFSVLPWRLTDSTSLHWGHFIASSTMTQNYAITRFKALPILTEKNTQLGVEKNKKKKGMTLNNTLNANRRQRQPANPTHGGTAFAANR